MGIIKAILTILAISIIIYGLWFILNKAFVWAVIAIIGAIVFGFWLVKSKWGL